MYSSSRPNDVTGSANPFQTNGDYVYAFPTNGRDKYILAIGKTQDLVTFTLDQAENISDTYYTGMLNITDLKNCSNVFSNCYNIQDAYKIFEDVALSENKVSISSIDSRIAKVRIDTNLSTRGDEFEVDLTPERKEPNNLNKYLIEYNKDLSSRSGMTLDKNRQLYDKMENLKRNKGDSGSKCFVNVQLTDDEAQFVNEVVGKEIENRLGKSPVYKDVIYTGTKDGDGANAFHSKCDQAGPTLVLVETVNGKKFGGFTTESWAGQNEKKYDDKAFVFSINKRKIYNVIQGREAISAYVHSGPCFTGCQIRIFEDFFTKGGSTYKAGINYETSTDFELTDGEQEFQIREIDVLSCK